MFGLKCGGSNWQAVRNAINWIVGIAAVTAGQCAVAQDHINIFSVPYARAVNGVNDIDPDARRLTKWPSGLSILVYSEPRLANIDFIRSDLQDFLKDLEPIFTPHFRVVFDTGEQKLNGKLGASLPGQDFNLVIRLSPYWLEMGSLDRYLSDADLTTEVATNGQLMDLETYSRDLNKLQSVTDARNPGVNLTQLRNEKSKLGEGGIEETAYLYQPLQQVNCRSLVARGHDHLAIGGIVDISTFQVVQFDQSTGRWTIPSMRLDSTTMESSKKCVYNALASIFGLYIDNELRVGDIRQRATEFMRRAWND